MLRRRGGPSQATGGSAALACTLRLGLEDVTLLDELSRACQAAEMETGACAYFWLEGTPSDGCFPTIYGASDD